MIKTEEAPVPTKQAPPPLKAEGAPVKLVKKKAEARETTVKQLREFGWLVGGLFTLLGLIALHHGKWTGPIFTPIGGFLLIFGTFAPRVLGPVYAVWMGFAERMGKVMTFIILTLFYVLYMAPVAMVRRAFGSDDLNLKIDKQAASYWEMRKNPTPSKGERLTAEF